MNMHYCTMQVSCPYFVFPQKISVREQKRHIKGHEKVHKTVPACLTVSPQGRTVQDLL